MSDVTTLHERNRRFAADFSAGELAIRPRRPAEPATQQVLAENRHRVDAVCAAAGLALENERLQVELRARLAELRASRARIVEAGDEERRKLERNLHDGAQQRLVSLSLDLRLAQSRLDSDPTQARELLEAMGSELALAIEELRDLARGIHPAILTEQGLELALESLVARSPLAVALDVRLDQRLPEPVEAAIYYAVAEALTNVVKYAEATTVAVHVTPGNGSVSIEIYDDGIGGADPSQGSGLRGLADRLDTFDGRLEVVSQTGSGTTIRAEIPLA